MKQIMVGFVFALLLVTAANGGEYLGQFSKNAYTPNSTSGYGSNNYRIRQSMENKYSSGGAKLYDSNGNFRGNLNSNRYDPNSVSNPYGRYGSKYSSDSLNNPYGAGSKYRHDSPNNRYGSGYSIYDE